jgi:hypothetical protein
LHAVGFHYSDAQRAQGGYSFGVGDALISGVGLGVKSLQSTRIQSTHPPWGIYTGGGWMFFVRLLYQFGFRGI